MTRLALHTITKAYLLLVFLVAMLISSPPYSIVALILLALQLCSVYKPPRAGLNLALVVCTLILTPLTLELSVGKLFSVFLVIPALPLLHQGLTENAPNQFFSSSKDERKATTISKALATTLLLLLISSVVLLNQTLILTTILLISYLAILLVSILHKIPKTPLEESKTWSRIVVGDTVETSATITGKAKMPLHVSLKSPCSWIHVEPSTFMLTARGKADVNLNITPPLAGPSKLQLQALAIDPLGLTQTSQTLEPVELHIIPRARYAVWLARKYLEETAPGTAPAAAIPPLRILRVAKRGVEYYGNRGYQPGDRLKDIDWKHTFKLHELVVKEFVGAHGQPTIMVVNLVAKDIDEADRLAYNLVMSALTLARESIPTGLAAYSQKEVLVTTSPTNPRDTLKKALSLTQNILVIKPLEKTLQPPEILRLNRSIGQLERVKTESAQKLAEILQLEHKAILEAAKDHPASQALKKTVELTPPPAIITVVSLMSHDADALAITLEKMREKGYKSVFVELKRNGHTRRFKASFLRKEWKFFS